MLFTSLVSAVTLFLAAIGHWDYGLSLPFRLLICACAGLLFGAACSRHALGWQVVLLVIVLLFNPIVPVRLATDSLVLLDLVASVCLAAAGIELS